MKPKRGQWRSITVVLLDGPDFQKLPAEARWVFVCLKCSLGPCGIQVEYPAGLVEKLAGRSGHSPAIVAEMLDVLQAAGWVRTERNVVWAVGQLQNEPSLSPNNDNHKPTILAHVQGLPRLGIVGDFIRASRDYFADPDTLVATYPKPAEDGSVSYSGTIPHPIPHPMGDQGRGQGRANTKSEYEEVSVAAVAAAECEPPKKVPHTMGSCLALVVEKLYFGRRPLEREMQTNGSVLKAFHAKGVRFDRLARAIEGLAERRNRGDLYGVMPKQVVSLKWLNAKEMELNQVAVSEDAYYAAGPAPAKSKAGIAEIGDVIGSLGRRTG